VVALQKVRDSGRKLILVTGRQLEDLLQVFERLDLFDRVVAENGAVLYCPETREERILAEPEDRDFVLALHEAGVMPLSEGKVIVSTQRPNETKILEIIRDMGFELHVIFNQSAVMVLPSGVNKASGMKAGLHDVGLSPHNCVGVGDAENDHAFLAVTECSVAVANAIEALKKKADYVTTAAAGEGVVELIDQLLSSDLQQLPSHTRHRVPLGLTADNREASINAYGSCVLIAGPSGSGKSTIAHAAIEKLCDLGYQFCIVDPEGDYLNVEGIVVLGDSQRPADSLRGNETSRGAIAKRHGEFARHSPEREANVLRESSSRNSGTGGPDWTASLADHRRDASRPSVPLETSRADRS
jgi:hydroxymethylpyrimidine pyrophosphatase-like HAD family hydrolase